MGSWAGEGLGGRLVGGFAKEEEEETADAHERTGNGEGEGKGDTCILEVAAAPSDEGTDAGGGEVEHTVARGREALIDIRAEERHERGIQGTLGNALHGDEGDGQEQPSMPSTMQGPAMRKLIPGT